MAQGSQSGAVNMPQRIRPAEESQLLLLEMISRLGPVTDAALLDFLTQAGLMNYLELMPALARLNAQGSLDCFSAGTDRRYAVTDAGLEVLAMYRGRIPDSDLQVLEDRLPGWAEALREQRDYQSAMRQTERGDYLVTLRLMERGEPALEMNVRVPASEIADRLVRRWTTAGGKVYLSLLEPLMGKGEE